MSNKGYEDICDECGTKMKLKRKFSVFHYTSTTYFKLYQCPECKNIELFEKRNKEWYYDGE